MQSLFQNPMDLLRGVPLTRAETAAPPKEASLARLIATIFVFGGIYGAVMGGYNTHDGFRILQALYSAIKVPMLLLVTFLLSLPSFFLFNTLLGLRDDFRKVLRALLTCQAGQTILLASLAPFSAFWNFTTASHSLTILFNGLLFGVSTFAAQLILRREYRQLAKTDSSHWKMLPVWLLTYSFVGIQMAWVLRPFVGQPGKATTFFREDSWSNAYMVIVELLRQAVVQN